MNEPLDDDDCLPYWSDPVDDEIIKLTGDNRALRMILKDCKGAIQTYRAVLRSDSDPQVKQRLEMLVQQIDDELKSE